DHPYRAAAGLLLSLALLDLRAASSVDRDGPDAGRSGPGHGNPVRPPVHLRHGGEELSPATRVRDRRRRGGHRDRDPHVARHVVAMVARHGRMERRSDAPGLRAQPVATRAAGRAPRPEQAVPELPRARRRGRAAPTGARPASGAASRPGGAARRSTIHRPASRGTSWYDRSCKAVETCPLTERT